MSLEAGKDPSKFNISYSLLSTFNSCRKEAFYSYVEGLTPQRKVYKLDLGTLFHACLEDWYKNKDRNRLYQIIDKRTGLRKEKGVESDEWNMYCQAMGMIDGYINYYGLENEMETVSTENKFEAQIIDTDTGEPIKGVIFYGKVDGIVQINGEYFILEHKTAKDINYGYMDKLWSDFQIILYSYYASRSLGFECSGVQYNVIIKPTSKYEKGESDEEYNNRCADKAKTNKTGKCRIKQKVGESEAEYISRIRAEYQGPNKFYREEVYIMPDLVDTVIKEVSDMTKAFITSYKKNKWYRNTNACWKYGSPCQFWSICKSNANQNIIDNYYIKKERKGLNMLYIDDDSEVL